MRYDVELKRLDTEEYLLQHSLQVKVRNRQNLSVMIKFEIVFVSGSIVFVSGSLTQGPCWRSPAGWIWLPSKGIDKVIEKEK